MPSTEGKTELSTKEERSNNKKKNRYTGRRDKEVRTQINETESEGRLRRTHDKRMSRLALCGHCSSAANTNNTESRKERTHCRSKHVQGVQ